MIKINLYGSPSSGKTTLAGQIFVELKKKRYNPIYVQEFAKELVFQGIDMKTLSESERLRVFVKQLTREQSFKDTKDVEFIITDSPMLLTAYYHQDPQGLEDWSYAREIALRHTTEDEIHFWLDTVEDFEVVGRSHDEAQSKKIAKELRDYLINCGVELIDITGSPEERLSKIISSLSLKSKRK